MYVCMYVYIYIYIYIYIYQHLFFSSMPSIEDLFIVPPGAPLSELGARDHQQLSPRRGIRKGGSGKKGHSQVTQKGMFEVFVGRIPLFRSPFRGTVNHSGHPQPPMPNPSLANSEKPTPDHEAMSGVSSLLVSLHPKKRKHAVPLRSRDSDFC